MNVFLRMNDQRSAGKSTNKSAKSGKDAGGNVLSDSRVLKEGRNVMLYLV